MPTSTPDANAGAVAGPGGWLQDFTVAEITGGVAGSTAGAILAALGARVRKLVPSGLPHPPEEALAALDIGKEIVAVEDERHGKEVLENASVVIADIITTPAPGRRQLIETARSASPAVLVWLTSFGLDGPRRDLRGSDLVSLASAGVLGNGIDSRRARQIPAGDQGLVTAGQVAALAAVHGLDRFASHRQPVEIDVSAQEAVAFITVLTELSLRLAGQSERPAGVHQPAPTGIFQCCDGLVHIVAPDSHQWQGLVRVLGNPGWAAGVTKEDLRVNRDDINQRIADWMAGQDRGDCVAQLQRAGVPAAEVNDPLTALNSDQFRHRGFFLRRPTGTGTTIMLPGLPLTVTTTPDGSSRAPKGLADTTVAEISGALAGPLTGSLLGAMGARVVRIGNQSRVDILQRLGPFIGGQAAPDRSISFNAVNHSKTWLAADFADVLPAEAESALAKADVVVDNLSSDYRARLGLDKRPFADDNLSVTISGFGRTGPRSSYRAYGPNVHSYAGLTSVTSSPDGWPWERETPIGDTTAAVTAATVITAWTLGGGRSGVVDLSLAEVVASRLTLQFARAQLAAPAGSQEISAVLAAGQDSWLAVSVWSTAEAAELAALVRGSAEGEEPGDDEQSALPATAAADPGGLLRQLEPLLAGRTAAEWCDILQRGGVAAFPVLSVAELAVDRHLRSRGFVAAVHPVAEDDPGLRVGLPWRFTGEEPLSPGPVVGLA